MYNNNVTINGDSLTASSTAVFPDYTAVNIPLHINFLNSKSSLVVPKNAFN